MTNIVSNISHTRTKKNKYIIFSLGNEEYGVSILKVMEMIGGIMDITHIPNTPEYIKGILNLRGKIIPIIDMRIKFGLETKDQGDRTSIIIMEVEINDNITPIGAIVDSINEVLQVDDEQIEKTPSFGVNIDTHFILGIAKAKGKVKILLDIDKVLTNEEANAINKINN